MRKQRTEADELMLKFRLWLGDDPIHNAETGELVGWHRTEIAKLNCYLCWKKKGISPWLAFLKEQSA